MKKVVIVIAIIVIAVSVLGSCKSQHAPCPAYGQVETTQADTSV